MALVVAAVGVLAAASCGRIGSTPGYPLYPSSGTPLPPEKLARLVGPIASVDGQKVATKGSTFDLLPGCHVVAMQHNVGSGTASGAMVATFGNVIFAFAMKPAYLYSIQLDMPETTGPTGWVTVKARERAPTGTAIALYPARGQADIDECRQWAKSAGY